MRRLAIAPLVVAATVAAGCFRPPLVVAPVALGEPPAIAATRLDSAPKEVPRLIPAEAYMWTYLQLFGGLAPTEVTRRARGSDGNQLFDSWYEYLAALGFPDYRLDLPRATHPNAHLEADRERLVDAL
jgi:hypothetical protein